MTNKKTQNRGKDSVNPIVAGVTGAVIGAGIAVAGAAVVLNDKKSREKVKGVLSNVKNQVVGYMEDMQKQAQDKKTEVKEKIAESEKTVKKTAKPA
jgi:hypothetical protein